MLLLFQFMCNVSLFEHVLSILGWLLKGRFPSGSVNRTCWLINSISERIRIFFTTDESRNENFCLITTNANLICSYLGFHLCIISSSMSLKNNGHCSAVVPPRLLLTLILLIFAAPIFINFEYTYFTIESQIITTFFFFSGKH